MKNYTLESDVKSLKPGEEMCGVYKTRVRTVPASGSWSLLREGNSYILYSCLGDEFGKIYWEGSEEYPDYQTACGALSALDPAGYDDDEDDDPNGTQRR